MPAESVQVRTAVAAVRRRLPGPVKVVARSVAGAVDPVRVRRFRSVNGVSQPIPPRRLRTRIGSTTPEDYVEKGRLVADAIERSLDSIGRPLSQFRDVLDFGCGTGRVLDHVLPRLSDPDSVVAVDVDSESIAWAQAQGRPAQFEVSGYAPPLRFADESFDLVYAISIFTHLDTDKQDAWLAELRRVLRPGGLGLFTVLGHVPYDRVRRTGDLLGVTQAMVDRAREMGTLDEEGLAFLPYVRRGVAAQGSPDMGDEAYGLTFHSAGYLQQHWARTFDVRGHLPRSINVHQDVVLVSRPAG